MRQLVRFGLVACSLLPLACDSDETDATGDAGGDATVTAPASGGTGAGGTQASGGTSSGGVSSASGGAGGTAPSTGGASQAGSDSGLDAANDAPRVEGCAAKTYKLCEDFESAADGELPEGWTRVGGWNDGAAVVTSAEHHRGSKALASAVAVNGQPRAGHSLEELGTTAGTHWGRIFYKVKTPVSLPPGADGHGVIHGTLVGLRGSDESRVVDTVVNSSGAHQFLYNLPDDSCCAGSAYDYHSYDGVWHCAEWYIDAVTQSFHFFYEGTEVESIGFENRSASEARIEQFTTIAVGWLNYQTPHPPYYEVWFDDLAIDDTRIGCDE